MADKALIWKKIGIHLWNGRLQKSKEVIWKKIGIHLWNGRLQKSKEVMTSKHSRPEEEQEGGENPELTEDLILLILIKLPLKTLSRFRCACKHWYNHILSPHFIARYCKINPKKSISAYCSSIRPNTGPPLTTTISFLFNGVPMNLTIPFEIEKLKIVGCSEGVVCLSLTEDEDRFLLWNPLSGQFREVAPMIYNPLVIKEINRDLCASGFFFDPIANTFKVLKVVSVYNYMEKDRNESVARVSIFSVSDNSWRNLRISIPFQLCGKAGASITRAVCVKRCMFWVIGLYFHDSCPKMCEEAYVLCFDMVNESFKKMEMPPRCDIKACKIIAAYKESLAVILHHNTIVRTKKGYGNLYDVWMMKDSRGDGLSWRKILTFSPPVGIDCDIGFLSKDKGDWIAMQKFQEKEQFLYNPETEATEKVSGAAGKLECFSYCESLISSLMMAKRAMF